MLLTMVRFALERLNQKSNECLTKVHKTFELMLPRFGVVYKSLWSRLGVLS